MEKDRKIFRSIIQTLIDGQTNFSFSLEIGALPAKYIEMIGYGIHEKGTTNLYTLNFSNLFDNPILCHSGADQSFMNFSHGMMFSVDQKGLNGLINCNISPAISLGGNETSTICLYFVIHY